MQQPKQQENIFSHMARRSPTTVSSISSWHPINASPSEDMWELPASSSSFSDDRDDFHASGLHQEFSIYSDTDDYSATASFSEHPSHSSLPPSVTIRTNRNNTHRNITNTTSRQNQTTGMGLSKQRLVLGDATNTLRRQNNASNTTRRVQRSYFG